ncbi:MAG: hypothetical protein HOI41_03215, partial [Acidimicrobiaceae bacterium]|nr:hypothetical protein [Acidimicrobiaceae bacterium]
GPILHGEPEFTVAATAFTDIARGQQLRWVHRPKLERTPPSLVLRFRDNRSGCSGRRPRTRHSLPEEQDFAAVEAALVGFRITNL